MKKGILYLNQFFSQIGSEDMASTKPIWKEEKNNVSLLFEKQLKNTEIIGTIICGDNYFNENKDKALKDIFEIIKNKEFDFFIAGPAFNAGRYAMACAELCKEINKEYSIPAVTGMYHENPAVNIFKKDVYIIKTKKTARDMRNASEKISNLILELLENENVQDPEKFDYYPKGKRINLFKEKNGAKRALEMLLLKINGEKFISEIPLPEYDNVKRAKKLTNLKNSKIALITTGGIVPIGNPDHLPAATAKKYEKYYLDDKISLKKGEYESVHAGYDPVYANENPNRVAPYDLLKKMESENIILEAYNYLYTTTGNSTSVLSATKMGKEIAQDLIDNKIDGALITST